MTEKLVRIPLSVSLIALTLLLCALAVPGSWAASHSYDRLNRITSAEYDEGGKVTYTYDALGNILSAVPGFGSMVVMQGGSEIPADGVYEFDPVSIGLNRTVLFEIYNLGEGSITLTGSPKVVVTDVEGDGEFVVSSQPLSSTIPSQGSVPFYLRFRPSSVSESAAEVSIPNSDPHVDPYTFIVRGLGLPANSYPHRDIGSIPFYGYGNTVEYCGKTGDKPRHVIAVCSGRWYVDPVSFNSYCAPDGVWNETVLTERVNHWENVTIVGESCDLPDPLPLGPPTVIDIGVTESEGVNNTVTFCGRNKKDPNQPVKRGTATCENGYWWVNPLTWESFCSTAWTGLWIEENRCGSVECDHYSWHTGEWGSCEGECGGQGIQVREVYCVFADGIQADDCFCKGVKPETTRSCDTPQCDPEPIDIESNYTEGRNNAVTFCGLYDGNSVLGWATCRGEWFVDPCNWDSDCDTEWENIGSNTGGCEHDCLTYSWYTGQWGGCSAECDWGHQTRTVYCVRSDGERASDSFCTGEKPTTYQKCYIKCAPTHIYIGSSRTSGANNIVEYCGISGGKVVHRQATCDGNWTVDPCTWYSKCYTGWYDSKNLDHIPCTADCD